jgi:hypothetical protein
MKICLLIIGFAFPFLSFAQEVTRNSNIESWDTKSLCKVANHPTEGYRVRLLLRSRGAACVSREEGSNSGASNWIVDTVSGCIARNPFPKTGESIRWYGQCVNNYITGYGNLEWFVNGQLSSYREGYYDLGYSEGFGVTTYIDKSYFVTHEGISKSSMWNGPGTLVYPNNTKYIGDFLDGKRSGQGVLYDLNDRVLQSGLWESNKFIDGQAIQNSTASSNLNSDRTAQVRKKCIRLGLLPGTEDFNLCLKGESK